MKTKVLLIVTFVFSLFMGVKAQSPDLINYQAVARDLSGNPLVSTAVNITYDIRQNSSTGTIVYSETHNLTTNQFGLFTAEIGGGVPVTGTFSGINWSTGLYYLQVTVNGDVMAATQLLSVPYALHANTATSGTPGANGHANLADSVAEPAGLNCANGGYLIHMGADDNDNNILEPLERDISYYICNGLDGTANNNDTSATNELQTLAINGDTLFISGGNYVLLPAALGDDWGSQVVVTSGTNISGDGTSGNPLMVTDSVDDADNDPNNERITTFALNSTSDSLIIVESGVGHAFPLSNLNDGDWIKGLGADIFNNSDSVGVGTNNPKSLFQIGDNMHLFPFSLPAPEEYAVSSYNSHHDGTAIRNTTGGVSGFSFIGHKTGQPNYGLHLFAAQPAGTDMTLLNPDLKINLSHKGFGVYVDNPDAGIDVEPIDSAGIMIRMANNGSTANLFFEDTQNLTVGLKAPTVLTNNYGLTLPVNLPTTSGSSLVSDLAGNLSWAPIASYWASTNTGSIHPSNLTDNVGIGVNNASSPLTINTKSGTEIEFAGGFNADISSPNQMNFISGALTQFEANSFSFYTASTHRMSILNNGRVGIGTSTPLDKFHVFETTNLDVLFQSSTGLTDFVLDAAVNRADIIFKRNGALEGSMGYNLTNDYLFLNDGVESLISRNGDIGIGTNTPTEKLDVVGDVIAHNYKYATPKARYLTIGETDFRMARSRAGDIESTFGTGGVGIVNATGSNTLVAPVYLPNGAVVTNVEVYYVDNSTSNMTVYFERRVLTGGLSTISSATTAVNVTTVQNFNLAGTTTIDNANNSYSVRVFSNGWSTNTTLTMKIYTVKIHYTITETD